MSNDVGLLGCFTYRKGPIGYAVLRDGKPFGSINDRRNLSIGWQVSVPSLNAADEIRRRGFGRSGTIFPTLAEAKNAIKATLTQCASASHESKVMSDIDDKLDERARKLFHIYECQVGNARRWEDISKDEMIRWGLVALQTILIERKAELRGFERALRDELDRRRAVASKP